MHGSRRQRAKARKKRVDRALDGLLGCYASGARFHGSVADYPFNVESALAKPHLGKEEIRSLITEGENLLPGIRKQAEEFDEHIRALQKLIGEINAGKPEEIRYAKSNLLRIMKAVRTVQKEKRDLNNQIPIIEEALRNLRRKAGE